MQWFFECTSVVRLYKSFDRNKLLIIIYLRLFFNFLAGISVLKLFVFGRLVISTAALKAVCDKSGKIPKFAAQ